MALACVVVVSVLAGSFLQLSTSLTRRQRGATDRKDAFYLAEAGLAEAYTGLTLARTGAVGSMEDPAVFGNGVFWVEVDDLGDGVKELESTALAGGGRATLSLILRRESSSLATLGIFSNQGVTVQPDGFVDGYDSSVGSYADQVATGTNAGMGLLGSNGEVTLDGGATSVTIDGDVVPGPGQSVTITGAVTVTGATDARGELVVLPPVELPSLPSSPAVYHTDSVALVIPAGEHGFDGLRVGPSAEIIVTGPATLRTSTLLADARGRLTFDTSGGPIVVYVTEEVNLASRSSVTTSSTNPGELSWIVGSASGGAAPLGGGTPPTVALNASSAFHGFVYAPESTVAIGPSFEVFGAVVADQLTLAAQGRLHFDRALAAGGGTNSAMPVLLAWRIVDIPPALTASSADPFKLLGVNRSALRMPADAHADQWLSILYLDLLSVAQTYDGWESAFDWSGVTQVLSGTRDGADMTEFQQAGGMSVL